MNTRSIVMNITALLRRVAALEARIGDLEQEIKRLKAPQTDIVSETFTNDAMTFRYPPKADSNE